MPFINPVSLNVNDMAAIDDINEVDLLNNIRNRFFQKNIQTNVGPTLIIMNPYEYLDGTFGETSIKKFIDVSLLINISILIRLISMKGERLRIHTCMILH